MLVSNPASTPFSIFFIPSPLQAIEANKLEMSSTPMSTQALRVGAIALIVIAYWYWSTSKPSEKENNDDKKTSRAKSTKTITTTTTTTTTTRASSKTPEEACTTTTETVVHDRSIDSGKKDVVAIEEETVVTEITTSDIKPVPEDDIEFDEDDEEENVTVQISSREISSSTTENSIEDLTFIKADIVETEVIETITEEFTTTTLAASEIQLTESFVQDMSMTESEIIEQVQEFPQEEIEEEIEQEVVQDRQLPVGLSESAIIVSEADISYEENQEEEEDEESDMEGIIEENDDEFESILTYTITSPANSKGAPKVEDQQQTKPNFVERDIFAPKPETIQTPTKETTEGSDQADTPTTLVGEELELTKDTLQTLQEVSRVAKHSELNAGAAEFKPSWLSSSQQDLFSPAIQLDSPKQITKLKSRCHYWPNCTNKACKYTHPSQPCRDGDQCRFGERCIFIHPKDQNTPRSKKSTSKSAGGAAPSSHGRRTSSATMTSVSPVEPWGRA